MPRLIKVAGVDEIPEGTLKTFDVEGRLVLLANVEGKIYAMDAICSHEEWDLSEGELQGAKVTCAGHGAVWDLTTGTAEFDEPLPALKTYRTLVKDGFVYVEVD